MRNGNALWHTCRTGSVDNVDKMMRRDIRVHVPGRLGFKLRSVPVETNHFAVEVGQL